MLIVTDLWWALDGVIGELGLSERLLEVKEFDQVILTLLLLVVVPVGL